MSDVLIPANELNFLLWDWLDVGTLLGRAGDERHDREMVEAVLKLSTHLAKREFLLHFKNTDWHEPSIDANGQYAKRIFSNNVT